MLFAMQVIYTFYISAALVFSSVPCGALFSCFPLQDHHALKNIIWGSKN